MNGGPKTGGKPIYFSFMKEKFWKITAIIAILLWIATLCTWYIIKTTPPRYIKSDSLVIDTKENKIYNPYKNSWEIWNPDIK